jgi:hypothetical protein
MKEELEEVKLKNMIEKCFVLFILKIAFVILLKNLEKEI